MVVLETRLGLRSSIEHYFRFGGRSPGTHRIIRRALQTRSKNLAESPMYAHKSAVPKSAVSAFPKTGDFGEHALWSAWEQGTLKAVVNLPQTSGDCQNGLP